MCSWLLILSSLCQYEDLPLALEIWVHYITQVWFGNLNSSLWHRGDLENTCSSLGIQPYNKLSFACWTLNPGCHACSEANGPALSSEPQLSQYTFTFRWYLRLWAQSALLNVSAYFRNTLLPGWNGKQLNLPWCSHLWFDAQKYH